MAIEDELDKNVADFRNMPEQLPPANANANPAQNPRRNFSRTELIWAVVVMVGFIVVVYLFLQKRFAPKPFIGNIPAQQIPGPNGRPE